MGVDLACHDLMSGFNVQVNCLLPLDSVVGDGVGLDVLGGNDVHVGTIGAEAHIPQPQLFI